MQRLACLAAQSASLQCADAQKVYANLACNVLIHVSVPALGLSATHWCARRMTIRNGWKCFVRTLTLA